MRVLHLIRTAGFGGAERVLLNGIPALREEGIDACVGVLDPGHEDENVFLQMLKEHQVPWLRYVDRGRLQPTKILKLAMRLKKQRIDILHVHGYRAAMYGLPAARMAGCKVLLTRHGVLSRHVRERMVEEVERVLSEQMDAIVPVAEHLKGSNDTLSRVIHNCIPIPSKSSCSYPGNNPRKLLYVGRLSQEKAPFFLIDAFAEVQERVPDVTLDIVGDGPLFGEVERYIRVRNLSSHVTLHGFMEPTPFYEKSDVLVISSKREGLPMVALEAMSYGLPVVSTDVGGMSTLLGGCIPAGLLAPSDDLSAFARQINSLLMISGLARAFGQQARKRIVNRHHLQRWAQEHAALYDELYVQRTHSHHPDMLDRLLHWSKSPIEMKL
ncbi:MAG TPA: hypothetical protein DCE42_24400 [Myxococcales bacterium]|nr:hypothetical protein [Deltaproteobacteria bacterium]MBU51727.1 hypothetical protein [Deltaproteobacteria bacterium]HAA57928.1 hypothetical protein [Myxococcales bacterium]|tara:strand:+ start:5648 stop:6793 length:1146 start_codon:yes stop_codon:yes gene_type:complete